MIQAEKQAVSAEKRGLWPERAKEIVALGLAAISLAGVVPQAESAPKAAHPISVGFVEDGVRQEDESLSKARMQEVVDASADEITVTIPWTYPGGAEVLNDEKRVCTPARLAGELGLRFSLSIIPVNGSGGVNKLPDRPSEVQKFSTAMGAWVHTLKRADCAPDMDSYRMILFNEPNSRVFGGRQLYQDGSSKAAKLVTRATYRGYQVIKQEAEKLDVDVTVLGGALASNKKPIEFVQQMGQAKQDMGISEPIMDGLAYHAYPKDSTEPPETVHTGDEIVGMGDLNDFVEAVDRAKLGARNMPIVISEIAYESTVVTDKINLYQAHSGTQDKTVSEKLFSTYFRDVLRLASCNDRVSEVDWFHLRDDQELDQWQSGLRYFDGLPKSSYERIVQAIKDAKAGNYICSK